MVAQTVTDTKVKLLRSNEDVFNMQKGDFVRVARNPVSDTDDIYVVLNRDRYADVLARVYDGLVYLVRDKFNGIGSTDKRGRLMYDSPVLICDESIEPELHNEAIILYRKLREAQK
ncbi:hypothetical protein HY450_00970 [Candidatus Pacearchaeota archaeon]|nr:hypothetical protein [Candidatus Pacearchaeota archaeon]